MYTLSLFTSRVFRDSDDLDITDLPSEFAEYQLWAQTNTPTYVTYHPSEKSAFAAFQIPLLLENRKQELSSTNSEAIGLFMEQTGHPEITMGIRNEIYQRYADEIYGLDENYDLGNMEGQAKPDFQYRFTASEDSDHIIMPLTIGRDIIHEIHCDGIPILFEQSQYNPTTRRLDIDILEGQKWKITI